VDEGKISDFYQSGWQLRFMKKRKKQSQIYGKELILDLYDCDEKIISSRKELSRYIKELCDLIKMRRYKKAIIEKFGFGKDFTKGFSFIQLIETSSIVGHVSELWKRVFINIFSCGDFDEKKAAEFTKNFFRAKKVKKRVLIR